MPINQQEWRLIDRFKEPSSYAGLAAGLAALGLNVAAPLVQEISLVGSAVCVGLSILMREGSSS